MKIWKISFGLAASVFAGSLIAKSANEVLVTEAVGKAGKAAVGLDIVSDGTVSGFDMKIRLSGASAKAVDTRSCLSDLPKGFSGACNVVGDVLYVYAIGDKMDSVLPAGMVSVGRVYVSRQAGTIGKAVQKTEVLEVNVSDASGKTGVVVGKVSAE